MSKLFRLYTSQKPKIKTVIVPYLGRYYQRPFSGNRKSVLVVYCDNVVAISQVFPFFYYSSDLAARYGTELRALPITQFLDSYKSGLRNADIVMLQTWFTLAEDLKTKIFDIIHTNHPAAKIVYLDWFAPLDLRLVERLNDAITIYVKKQIFRDKSNYEMPMHGATNLEDYYGKLYGLKFQAEKHSIPADFFAKLVLGPGFFTIPTLIEMFIPPQFPEVKYEIDVHARMTAQRDDWYGHMRQDALKSIQTVTGRRLVTDFGVSRKQFYWELRRSKICFSPFGYGEVCVRDYEAFMAGSLLIKPDVSHLITDPDIFIPFETYVPVDWRFSDVREKTEYYLTHEDERRRIVENAYRVLHNYVVHKKFLDFTERIFEN